MWRELFEDIIFSKDFKAQKKKKKNTADKNGVAGNKNKNKNHAKMPLELFVMLLSVFRDKVFGCQL